MNTHLTVVTAADVVSTDPSWCCPLLGAYPCEQSRRGCYCHELHLLNQHNEDQRQWYFDIYLPLVKRAMAGERIDPWLLAGGQRQANEDQTWDQRNGDDWA
jgi:hypothetical protein